MTSNFIAHGIGERELDSRPSAQKQTEENLASLLGPWFEDADVARVQAEIPRILRGSLSNGRWTAEFEVAAAASAGTRYAVAFPSCTAALESTLSALAIEPGDGFLVPAQTFAATGMAVHLAGGRPVVCDIRPKTHCLDPDEIARKTTARTRGLILVHMGGLITPDLPVILSECAKRGLLLIEDCAHAHGASWNGRPSGSIGVAGCFSYHPTKILTTGEGGAVVTNDERIAAVARSLQNRGREMDSPVELYDRVGRNNRFPEISALLGVVQYRNLDKFVRLRNLVADYYRHRLAAEASEVEIQAHPAGVVHSYWKFLLNLPPGASRERMQERMKKRGVPVHWSYFPPLHLQPVFRRLFDYSPGQCPVAEDVLARNLCLPIHPRMGRRHAEVVIDCFLEAFHADRSQVA